MALAASDEEAVGRGILKGRRMTRYVVGIDIGGTKIAAGVVDNEAHLLSQYETKEHSGQPPEVVIEAALRAFQVAVEGVCVEKRDLEGVGVGFAGHTNGLEGIVLTSSNLPSWDHMPLRDVLARRLGMPVVLDNDCNVAALAEHRYGVGRGARHMVYVVFSTGVGAGIIYPGADGRHALGDQAAHHQDDHPTAEPAPLAGRSGDRGEVAPPGAPAARVPGP